MRSADPIIQYLMNTYRPEAIIAYGSFVDGSANLNSDFDALVIADCEKKHDASVIEGTVLDVFIYPAETFQNEYDPEEFVQVFDGRILLDENGMAEKLKERVLAYIKSQKPKTKEEVQQELDWCEKMLARTERGDAEGYYRWHWLLCDSLEIYFDLIGKHYYGPKKSLRMMQKDDPEGFRLYSAALKTFGRDSLSEWISYLTNRDPIHDSSAV